MAARRDFSGGPGAWPKLEEGADWVVSFRKGTMSNPNNPLDSDFTPTDVTGWTVTMKVRQAGPPAGGRELLDTSAYWTVGGADGRFTMSVPASETVGLGFTEGVYAIELTTPGGVPMRQWEGRVVYSPRVNRG